METKTKQILDTLKEDGAEDTKAMLDTLCDGEYLATKGWTQLEVEEAYNFLRYGI